MSKDLDPTGGMFSGGSASQESMMGKIQGINPPPSQTSAPAGARTDIIHPQQSADPNRDDAPKIDFQKELPPKAN